MATHDPLLSVDGLHVSYGTKEILHGIAYGVSEGEVVAVLGANGSGKSTSLNGVTMFTPFLRRGAESTVDDYIEAVDYVINIAGEDCVGIGTDFTQGHGEPFYTWITRDKGYARSLTEFGEIRFPDGFSTIGDFPNLTAAMERAGWNESRIRKILGLNWLKLLDEVWGR